MTKPCKVAFPSLGNYYIPISRFVKNTLNAEVYANNKMTKRTLELGTNHSPDFVCVPFKYNLGNFIEALEEGANVLIQAGGGCRYGYYSEVQEEILKSLGYDFKFFNITARKFNPLLYYKMLKQINPNLKFKKFLYSFYFIYKEIGIIDEIEHYIRGNIGFEVTEGEFEKVESQFHAELMKVETISQLNYVYKKYKNKFEQIPIKKPENCLKVGVLGEIYVLMEPFSNYYIEKELAKCGIAIKRYVNLTYLFFSKEHKRNRILKQAKPYLRYDIGADGTDTIAHAKELAEKGYDGVIHIKPFGCMPEINGIPVLNKISQEFKMPILYFSFDSQTSETGVKTRLEAFYDMLMMRKEKELT